MASSDLARRIKVVRIGLILRATLPEKSSDDSSTPATLSLFSDLGEGLAYTRELTSAERLYRYRTADATLVLRNHAATKN
jgi:hypothetical protein